LFALALIDGKGRTFINASHDTLCAFRERIVVALEIIDEKLEACNCGGDTH